MDNVPHSVGTFKDLMQWVLRETVQEMTGRLAAVLEKLEEQVHQDPEERRQRQGWESIGKRERSLLTLFGLEIRFSRRGYRRVGPDGQVEYLWPLDERLGLLPQERFCPLVRQAAVGLAAQSSVREAAAFVREYLQVPVSHQQVHRWVQAAGTEREAQEQERVEAVFAHGHVPPSEGRGAAVVVFEGDGLYVPLQREQARGAELKLGVMHEGWVAESPARRRFRLTQKAAWAGVLSAEAFWQRGVLRFHERYDEGQVGRVVVNGNGAEWVKAGRAHFAQAEVYLDPYHRNRALRQGLGFAPELLVRAQAAITAGDLGALEKVLAEAVIRAPGDEHGQRVRELRRYLMANRDGLRDWRQAGRPVPAGARGLGAAEGQINHVLARRMTKRGMSWRLAGAHRMALLRCLHSEGALMAWLEGWLHRFASPAGQTAGAAALRRQVCESLERTDPADWLHARLPLLATAAAQTELGRQLKALSRLASASKLRSTGQPAPWGARMVPSRSA